MHLPENEKTGVLVVGGDADQAGFLTELLARVQGAPFRVHCVERPPIARERSAQGGIDAVLLILPASSALARDAVQELRAQAPRAPVLLLAEREDEALAARLLRAGAEDFLVRPQVSGPALARVIRWAIERHRLREVAVAASREFERQRKERRRAEEVLNNFFVLAVEPLCIIGFDGRFRCLNPAWEALVGASLQQLMETPFLELVHPEDRGATAEEFRQLLAGAQTRAFENRCLAQDGSARWLLWKAASSPEEKLVYAAVHDITVRKQAEEALARSNAELERFAYVASHDLQEPLRMVASYTGLLARRYRGRLDERADRWIAYAVDGARRMQELIHDLLAYSRAQAEAGVLKPASLEAAFDTAVGNVRAAVEETSATITHDLLPTLAARPGQLVQLFQNLLSNALKFRGQDPPRIQVSAQPQGDHWLFAVRDNGVGFDPQDSERIFQLFERRHDKRLYPGTGLGLAICQRIVEAHGGRIWAESGRGAGATFYFTLPALEEEAAA